MLYPVPNVCVFVAARAVFGWVALRDTDTILPAVDCVEPRPVVLRAVAARDIVLDVVRVTVGCVFRAVRVLALVCVVRRAVSVVRPVVCVTFVRGWELGVRADTVFVVDVVREIDVASRTTALATPMHAQYAPIKSKIFFILV